MKKFKIKNRTKTVTVTGQRYLDMVLDKGDSMTETMWYEVHNNITHMQDVHPKHFYHKAKTILTQLHNTLEIG